MSNRNFVLWIATLIAIGNCGLCVQGFTFQQPQQEGHVKNGNVAFNNLEAEQEDIELVNEYLPEIDDSSSSSAQRNVYVNVSQYPGKNCMRQCKQGQNLICYYEFHMELYQAMGVACGRCSQGVEEDCNHPQCIVGDGFEKGVMSINRQIPGPEIQVCKDDLIIVDVHNDAAGTAATIHWHGIHQRETPFMDGMPFLTQCPIIFGNSFRYQFKATEAGTQFYHSHTGHHKTNGQYGVLTVRQPKESEPLSSLYDYDLPEHHIYASDWMHTYAENLFPGLPSSSIGPNSVLINGRGTHTDPQTMERSKVTPRIFYLISGKRYRFRMVNGISHACPFQLQVESHNFTIIAADSFTVMPHIFDTLISNAGERYDFVLEADQGLGDYWMRVRGLGVCTASPIESYALIRYVDGERKNDVRYMTKLKKLPVPPLPHYDVPFPAHTVLNHPNATCFSGESNQCITELTAYEDDVDLRTSTPDHKFYLAFNNYIVPNQKIFNSGKYLHFENLNRNLTMVAAINNLSLTFPDFSLLTQPELIDESQFCDENNRPAECEGSQICHCIHRLKIKKDSIVELIIVDETTAIGRVNHPFHLHGYRYMVTGIGFHPLGLPMTVKRAIQMDNRNLLSRDNLNASPPFKDTVSIPSRGYAIVRLRAINPGFWLMHCHYEWHLSIGMGLILQVGEPSEMVKAPSGFPKCGNYLPGVKRNPYQSHRKN